MVAVDELPAFGVLDSDNFLDLDGLDLNVIEFHSVAHIKVDK